jgi:hypothetical protein
MLRERVLKVVLVVVGMLFSASVLPVMDSLSHQNQSMYTFDMTLSLYVALGVFLLMAARNPSANRSLIAFTAWSSFAHAAVMTVTAFSKGGYRGDLSLAMLRLRRPISWDTSDYFGWGSYSHSSVLRSISHGRFSCMSCLNL